MSCSILSAKDRFHQDHYGKLVCSKISISFGSTWARKLEQLEINRPIASVALCYFGFFLPFLFYLCNVPWCSTVALCWLLWCFFLFCVGCTNWTSSTGPRVGCGFQVPPWIFFSCIIWGLGGSFSCVPFFLSFVFVSVFCFSFFVQFFPFGCVRMSTGRKFCKNGHWKCGNGLAIRG